MTTSNLGLSTSTPGVDTDADSATREQTNINLIDLHDHTSGKGVRVPTGGLNINADLPMGSNSLTGLKSNQFSSQSSALTSSNTIYVKNGELFYIDNAGNSVQITSGGSVSVATLLSGNVFLDGGNTRGANLRLGSNDNYSFFFKTNNTDRFQINGSGFMSFISDWGFSPSTNSSTGSINDVSTATTSYLQMTGAGSTTVTGLANGSSGKTLLISNQTGSGLTIKNESASSTAANRIQTGTGNDISIADKASAILIYNSTTSRWSLLTGAATAATLTNPIANVAANNSNVTFTTADNRIQICTPTAARTYTMPTTSISAGDSWEFYNTSTTFGNVITINASSGAVIDYCIPKGYIKLIALVPTPTAAADWKVLSAYSDFVTGFTPTFGAGFGTVTAPKVQYKRDKKELYFRVSFTTGSIAAAYDTISLPNSWTIASSSLTITSNTVSSAGDMVGRWASNASLANNTGCVVTAPGTSTSVVYFGAQSASAAAQIVPSNTGAALATTSVVVAEFTIPITQWS